ncbi:hypothetical protein F5146DRAFT_1004277 [Armillaria mellea]|nr:hypothetical protein F5146DRAFT_1004277 [Armillaria mellea]
MTFLVKNLKGLALISLSSHSSQASFQATADNIAAALAQPTISSSVAKDLLAWATSAAAITKQFYENTFTIADGLHTAFDQLTFSLHPIGSDFPCSETEIGSQTY